MKNLFKFIFLIILFNKINCFQVREINPNKSLFFSREEDEQDIKERMQLLDRRIAQREHEQFLEDLEKLDDGMQTISAANLSSNSSGKIVEAEMASDEDSSSMNDDKEAKTSSEKSEINAYKNLSQENAQEINACFKSLSNKKYNLTKCGNDLKELIDILFKMTFQHYKSRAEKDLKLKNKAGNRDKPESIRKRIFSILKSRFGDRCMNCKTVKKHLEAQHKHVYKVFEAILKLIQKKNSDSAQDTLRTLWYKKEVTENNYEEYI